MDRPALVEQLHKSLPVKGTEYYYLFFSMNTHAVEVRHCVWEDYMGDFFRFLKGVVYLTEDDAKEARDQMNVELSIMCGLRGYKRQRFNE